MPRSKRSPFGSKPHQSTNSNKNKPFVRAPSKKKRVAKAKPEKSIVVLFNKPFDVLTQFTDDDNRQTLKDFINIKDVYAAGRLDKDSEGLLVLTNDGAIQDLISHPKHHKEKEYWVQVEGIPDNTAISKLTKGVELKDGMTKPAKVKIIEQPSIWPRHPPIRERKNIPTTWLSIIISEGKNRQVRRMTAHVGHPTLRLVRASVGEYQLGDLQPGQLQVIEFN
ncbi:pseudouridine synthase [Marinifaba aquimaris]|uniref:pseudouridine synthase n=1 Tax=Marinifaba aquimaris TaxID=2741323 RepID=UPI0031B5D099